MENRDLYSGLIRLHILHHASEENIFGLAIIDELARHGYKVSTGTIYPLLHGMEERGYLISKETLVGGYKRRVYWITPFGKKALKDAKKKVKELFGELFEG